MLYGNNWNNIQPGYYLIRRPKAKGFICHYGILEVLVPMTYSPLWHQYIRVFEMLPGGYRETTPEGFADDQRVTIVEYKPLAAGPAILARVEQLRTKNFGILWNNCEHAARFAFYGKSESNQVKGWGVAALVLIGLFFGFRGGGK